MADSTVSPPPGRMPRWRRRLIFGAAFLLAVALIAGIVWLRQALQPCGALDIAGQHSGCTQVIPLIDFDLEWIAAAPDDARVAAIGHTLVRDEAGTITSQAEVWVFDALSGARQTIVPVDDAAGLALQPILFEVNEEAADRVVRQVNGDELPPGMGYEVVPLPGGTQEVALLTVDGAPQLVVRAVADGAVIRELPLAHSGVNTGAALYVSADGQRVAARFRTGTDARWLAAWDIPSGAPVLDLTWDAVQMTGALAWLPDDRTLAVGVRVPDTRNSQIAFFETGADA